MRKIVPTNAVLIPEQAACMFQGVIYGVYQWPQKLFDGSEATFEMLRRPDTVQILCVVDDQLLVLDEEQPHAGARFSFPGGRVDPGEDVLAAAKREALEETGYGFKNWRLVKVYQPITKMEWFIYLYIAWDVAGKVEPHLDAGEKITPKLIPFAETKSLVFDRAGYLGETQEVFESVDSVSELLALSEFEGKEIDR